MAMKVVLVDDDRHVRDVVAKMLAARQWTIVTLADGNSAVHRIREEQPDLVLLDIVLPGIDGTTVAQELREDPRTGNIPIVFLTGLVGNHEAQQNGNRIGGHYFLGKPFDAAELFELIDRALADPTVED